MKLWLLCTVSIKSSWTILPSIQEFSFHFFNILNLAAKFTVQCRPGNLRHDLLLSEEIYNSIHLLQKFHEVSIYSVNSFHWQISVICWRIMGIHSRQLCLKNPRLHTAVKLAAPTSIWQNHLHSKIEWHYGNSDVFCSVHRHIQLLVSQVSMHLLEAWCVPTAQPGWSAHQLSNSPQDSASQVMSCFVFITCYPAMKLQTSKLKLASRRYDWLHEQARWNNTCDMIGCTSMGTMELSCLLEISRQTK